MLRIKSDIEPANKTFTINHARNLFLEAVRKNKPEVLRDLVTIEFSSLSPLNKKSFVLRAWAEYWNLKADWILDIACQTIEARLLYKRQLEIEKEFPSPERISEIEFYKANGLISGKEKPMAIDEFLKSIEIFWHPSVTSWKISDVADKIEPPTGLPAWKAELESRSIVRLLGGLEPSPSGEDF